MKLFTSLLLLGCIFLSPDGNAQRLRAKAHYDLAIEQIARERYDSALYNLNRSIVLRRSADAYFTRGTLYEYAGEDLRAIDDFSSSIELRNDFTEAYFKRGEVYLKNGIYARAIKDFDYLIDFEGGENTQAVFFKIDPRGIDQVEVTTMVKMKASVKALRSQAYQAIGEYDKAMADITDAMTADSSAGNLVNRALLFEELGELEKAKQDLKWATAMEPSNEIAWFNLMVLDQETDVPETMQRTPSFGPMLSYRAVEEYEKGNLDKAKRLFDEALKLEPKNVNLLLNAGRLDLSQGDYGRARSKFLRVLDIDESRFEAYYLTGNTFFRERRFQDAAAFYEQFLARDKSNGSIWYNAAMTYFELDQEEEACTYLQRALDRGMSAAKPQLERRCIENQ